MTEEQLVERFERENITLASISSRALAFFVDELIVSVLFLVAFWGSFKSDDPEETIMLINSLFIYIISLKIIYHGFFVWMYGATPGKMLAKIRVIFIDDIDNPTLSRAFLRASVRVLSEAFFYLGFFWAFMNTKRQTWQDIVAKTLVINAK